jgi:hypothetical protein
MKPLFTSLDELKSPTWSVFHKDGKKKEKEIKIEKEKENQLESPKNHQSRQKIVSYWTRHFGRKINTQIQCIIRTDAIPG